MDEVKILKYFLELPLWTSKPIFDKFKTISNAVFKEHNEDGKERFLFIEGKKEKKVVLIAHADTYFDKYYKDSEINHHVIENNGCFHAQDKNGQPTPLGADDRAGCAILWLLKDSGHSILITDGEEHGQMGSKWLMQSNPDIADKINNHQFMIQFDRCNGTDFKCYNVGSDEFREFIKENTGYSEPDRSRNTDICTLCRDICGVNFSIGYYNEHKDQEYINICEWLNTLKLMKKFLQGDLPRFVKKD